MPRRAGFALGLIERIEDFVLLVLVPLYFAYSGLRTRVDALDTARAWGCVVLGAPVS